MTPEQIRNEVNTNQELFSLLPDYLAIANALSNNRTKLVPTEIGQGDIVAKLRELGPGTGGQFLDFLVQLGQVDRDLYWTMNVITAGRLRIDLPETRAGMLAIKEAFPDKSTIIDKLLELGIEQDVITEQQVKEAFEGSNSGTKIILITGQISFDGNYMVLNDGEYDQNSLVEVKDLLNNNIVAFSAKYIAFGI